MTPSVLRSRSPPTFQEGCCLEGTWKRDESKSAQVIDRGKPLAGARVMLRIKRSEEGRGAELRIERVVSASGGRDVRELKYSTDGDRNVNFSLRGVEIHSTSRLDGGTLAVEGRGVIDLASGRVEQFLRERWTLSPDARILTIASTVRVPTREISSIEVFTRQRWWWW